MTINKERRKRVMQRSIKLGHCVCDPKQPCPCEIFKEKNICLCAGERLEEPTGEVRLTQMVEKAGCGSKIDQAFLKEVLGDLKMPEDTNVLVGVPAGDDAGVYDMGNGTCLVQTVDVFTPTVDDPYMFGQIAAANSVSDVYAMGGIPKTALSIIGFPVRKVPDRVMKEIIRGGIDKMAEAGVSIIGGHSINDPEIKAGYAVTGTIDKEKVITNDGIKVDDVFILTKALGTGIISFASQIGRASKSAMEAAAKSMATLNKTACELMVKYNAHAASDVTGFSLIGHLSEMTRRSGVDVEITWDKLPWLPEALDYAAQGIYPGAIERNKESCGHTIIVDDNVSEAMADICFDAQTSGGMLIAAAPDKAEKLLGELKASGLEYAAIIGRTISRGSGKINIVTDRTKSFTASNAAQNIQETSEPDPEPCCGTGAASAIKAQTANAESCCCGPEPDGQDNNNEPIKAIETSFSSFMSKVNRPGGLDAFTKQAVNLALSIHSKCKPCLKTHIAKARKMGYTESEIDEAAWMAIAFGGSPAMMFYKEVKAEV